LVNGMLCLVVLCSMVPLAGGIDWAISIVIYGTRIRPNALYRTGCSECIDMTSIPTAVRYSVL
jgi:hypothetical protein